MEPVIITNNDPNEIDVKTTYDEKAEVYRIYIMFNKLKTLQSDSKWKSI